MRWFILLFLFQINSALATTFVPISIKKQIIEADGMIYGEVINSEVIILENGQIVTETFLKLNKWLDVEPVENHLTIYSPGGVTGERALEVEGTPKYSVGESVFLFVGKDKMGKHWVKNLGLGKYSEKMIGNQKILVNQIFPMHPEIGQIPHGYLIELAERIKDKKFSERFYTKYEVKEEKVVRTSKKDAIRRGVASAAVNDEEASESSRISIYWLWIIFGLIGAIISITRKKAE